MARVSEFVAAGVVALGLVAASVIPVGAAAASVRSTVPSPVSSWFASEALGVILDTAAGGTSLGEGRVDFGTATAVGTPHRIDAWSTAFLAKGKRYSSAISHSALWIAPISTGSAVIGTIVATSGTAGVSFVSYDDQADLGASLARASSATVVVHDPELSSWVSLKSGRVRAMTVMTAVDLPASKSLASYRSILIKRHASATANSKGKVGATGGGGPVIPVPEESPLDALAGWGGAGLVLLGGAGLALYLRARRRARLSTA